MKFEDLRGTNRREPGLSGTGLSGADGVSPIGKLLKTSKQLTDAVQTKMYSNCRSVPTYRIAVHSENLSGVAAVLALSTSMGVRCLHQACENRGSHHEAC